jgi:predicted nucleotidyltransferase
VIFVKVCGIIAEYNPFHNGHKYQIDYSKRELSSDFIIVVMSGNFVQRGAPSIIDKYYRTRMALNGGADLVIELPTFYALQSAEYFALGGVSLLDSLGVVNNISFGSESYAPPQSEIIDYISSLDDYTRVVIEQSIAKYCSQGNSYPLAYCQSLSDYLSDKGFNKDDVINTLSKPNTMLELMYLDALDKIRSNIKPFKVARKDADYHDTLIRGHISSASAIRKSIIKNNMYKESVPSFSSKLIESGLCETNGAVTAERFFKTFLYTAIKNPDSLSELADITGGLDKRMLKMLDGSCSMDKYIKDVKSKSYTYVRIARVIFNLLLGITAEDTALIRKDIPLYARILGFKKQARPLLDSIHEKTRIPVFTSPAKYCPILKSQERLFEIDMKASDIYYLINCDRFNKGSDYTNQIIIV